MAAKYGIITGRESIALKVIIGESTAACRWCTLCLLEHLMERRIAKRIITESHYPLATVLTYFDLNRLPMMKHAKIVHIIHSQY